MGGAIGWTKVSKERMSGTAKAQAGFKRRENTKAFKLKKISFAQVHFMGPQQAPTLTPIEMAAALNKYG